MLNFFDILNIWYTSYVGVIGEKGRRSLDF